MTVEEIIILLPEKVRDRWRAFYGASAARISTTMCSMAKMEQLTVQAFGLAERDEEFMPDILDEEEETEDEGLLFLRLTDLGEEVMERLGTQNESTSQ